MTDICDVRNILSLHKMLPACNTTVNKPLANPQGGNRKGHSLQRQVSARSLATTGPLGVSILFDVAQRLEQSQGDSELSGAYFDETQSHHHNYNESILVCLPKKKYKHNPRGHQSMWRPANTRPLNIVNADNRIMARAPHLGTIFLPLGTVLAAQGQFYHVWAPV